MPVRESPGVDAYHRFQADRKGWDNNKTRGGRASFSRVAYLRVLEVEYRELFILYTYRNVELPVFVRLFDKGLVNARSIEQRPAFLDDGRVES
jgi:hypothetical protein